MRCYVIVSRQALMATRWSTVVCAPIYSTRRGLSTEVDVGIEDGLKHPSAILCDDLVSLSKTHLTDYIGALSAAKLAQLRTALRIALAVE